MAILAPGTGTGSYPDPNFVPLPQIQYSPVNDFILGNTDTPPLPSYIPTSPQSGAAAPSTYDELKSQFLANLNSPMAPPLPVSLPVGNPMPGADSPFNNLAFNLAGPPVPIQSRTASFGSPVAGPPPEVAGSPYTDFFNMVTDNAFIDSLRTILHPDISDPNLNQDVTNTINDAGDAAGLFDGSPSEVFGSDFGSADTGALLPPEMPGMIGGQVVPDIGQITAPTIDTSIDVFGPGDSPTDIMNAFQDPSVFLNPDSPIMPGFNDDGSILPIDGFFNPPTIQDPTYGDISGTFSGSPSDVFGTDIDGNNMDTVLPVDSFFNPVPPEDDSGGLDAYNDVVYQGGVTPTDSPALSGLLYQADINSTEVLRDYARKLQQQGLLY